LKRRVVVIVLRIRAVVETLVTCQSDWFTE